MSKQKNALKTTTLALIVHVGISQNGAIGFFIVAAQAPQNSAYKYKPISQKCGRQTCARALKTYAAKPCARKAGVVYAIAR